MKTKRYTQEEVRLQIAEYLKDCSDDEFMAVTLLLFKDRAPEFIKIKCERGFRLIEMEE